MRLRLASVVPCCRKEKSEREEEKSRAVEEGGSLFGDGGEADFHTLDLAWTHEEKL